MQFMVINDTAKNMNLVNSDREKTEADASRIQTWRDVKKEKGKV